MATIPRLNRIEPSQALPQNDRINMQVKDQGGAILQQTSAVAALGDKVGDIYQKYENDKIDSLSAEAEREFTTWNNEELARLRAHEGDPTDAYVEYDKKVQEKRDAILNARPDLNERVKRHFTSRLDGVVGNQNVGAMKQRGMQQEVYINNTFESGVKLKKDSLPVNAGYIQKDDDSSFLMFDQGMADIKTLIAKRGIQKGTSKQLPDDAKSWTHQYQDDEGKIIKVSMSDIDKQRTAKELSEGVKSSIEVMIAGGQIEEAKLMQEKYKGYIDPASKVKLQNKFDKVGRKDEAYNFISGLNGKSEEAKITAIEGIGDPELRSEALKIKDADDKKLQSMRDRKGKANYDRLANHVLDRMNSDQPYYGVADLEKDPVYGETWDNLKPKDKKAVMEMVEAPKESNSKSEVRVQDLFFNPNSNIETMTPQEFNQELSGLSKADRSKYTTMYNGLRNQTESEKRVMYKQAGTLLQDQFLVDGHIKRDKHGNIRGDDEITLINARNKLTEHLSTQYGSFKPEQLQKFVKEFSAAEIKGKVYNPPSRKPAVKPPADAKPSGQIKVSRTQLNNLVRLYSKKNNGIVPQQNDPKFINFVQKNLNTGI